VDNKVRRQHLYNKMKRNDTMNPTFERLYRQVGRVTFGVLLAALIVYGLMLVCALLGFSHTVASLGGMAASLAYVFVALFGLFLVASVVAAVIRWFDRRNPIRASNPV
jgi:hypothetical protein